VIFLLPLRFQQLTGPCPRPVPFLTVPSSLVAACSSTYFDPLLIELEDERRRPISYLYSPFSPPLEPWSFLPPPSSLTLTQAPPQAPTANTPPFGNRNSSKVTEGEIMRPERPSAAFFPLPLVIRLPRGYPWAPDPVPFSMYRPFMSPSNFLEASPSPPPLLGRYVGFQRHFPLLD